MVLSSKQPITNRALKALQEPPDAVNIRYPIVARDRNPSMLGGLSDSEDDANDVTSHDEVIISPENHQYARGDFALDDFWVIVDRKKLLPGDPARDWSPAHQAQAQQILGAIFLGPVSIAQDLQFLHWHGITLLLAICDRSSQWGREAETSEYANRLSIKTDAFAIFNDNHLVTVFPHIIRRINDHLTGLDDGPVRKLDRDDIFRINKRKVLVFCETGNNHSACVVIAYIMAMLNKSPRAAMSMVANYRKSAEVSIRMAQVIKAFDRVLFSKREEERLRHARAMIEATARGARPAPSVAATSQARHADHAIDADGDTYMTG